MTGDDSAERAWYDGDKWYPRKTATNWQVECQKEKKNEG